MRHQIKPAEVVSPRVVVPGGTEVTKREDPDVLCQPVGRPAGIEHPRAGQIKIVKRRFHGTGHPRCVLVLTL